jgi:ATP-dependent protease HslVU (ClpYQ) peptidase subunit
MTCIVGMVKDNITYIGADSFAGGSDYRLFDVTDNKVVTADNFLIGCTFTYKMINILEFELDDLIQSKITENEIKLRNNNIEKYVRTVFNKYVIELFDKNKIDMKDENSKFIFGAKGKLWQFIGDGGIISLEKFGSVGSGTFSAISAMYALENYESNPEKLLEKALYATSKIISTVGGAFHIEKL